MKITDIINTEKRLLKLEDEHRFELTLNELIHLKSELEKVSKITSLFFDIQYDFSINVSHKEEHLKTYNESLTNCELTVDINSAIELADSIEARLA